MSSELEECFVYIQLPGTLDVVTCARFVLEGKVGRLAYSKRYLEDPRAVELDKFELPLRLGSFETARLEGVFGALRDSSPDSWGRRVIERELARPHLSEVELLLYSPEDRAGALSFGRNPSPPPPVQRFNKVLQLQQLLEEAERVDADEPPSPQIAKLVQPGTSMGGARPKNVVEDGEGLWLAKFPARRDRWNWAAVEAGMLRLAHACGIRAASARVQRVGDRDVLLVRRFDREKITAGYLRHRMVSALSVLKSEEDDRSRWSYPLLADELRRWSHEPQEDRTELFRRMVFNALISNTDDHPRNHALIAASGGWRLSPAYDLVPAPQAGVERDLALSIGAGGRRANRTNLLSNCGRFGLSREEANAIIDQTKARVESQWRHFVHEGGGTERDCARIESAFGYEGFEYAVDRVY